MEEPFSGKLYNCFVSDTLIKKIYGYLHPDNHPTDMVDNITLYLNKHYQLVQYVDIFNNPNPVDIVHVDITTFIVNYKGIYEPVCIKIIDTNSKNSLLKVTYPGIRLPNDRYGYIVKFSDSIINNIKSILQNGNITTDKYDMFEITSSSMEPVLLECTRCYTSVHMAKLRIFIYGKAFCKECISDREELTLVYKSDFNSGNITWNLDP